MTRSEPQIRPATLADLIAFYGKPPTRTVRAWVGILDGTVLAAFGLAYEDGRPSYFFSDLAPQARRYRRAILRGARIMLDALGEVAVPAFADPDIPGAGRFLERLGFTYVGETDAGCAYMRSATAPRSCARRVIQPTED